MITHYSTFSLEFLIDNIETADSLRDFEMLRDYVIILYSTGCTDIFKAWDNIHKGN